MPPKKKKSKAALEAELKAKQVEEERLRVEEEEKERLRLVEEEEEKQEQIRKVKIRNERFQQDEELMKVIKEQRKVVFEQKLKLINEETEWKNHLNCNESHISNCVDDIYLNSFLYEYSLKCEEHFIDARDICKFCDDVGSIAMALRINSVRQTLSDDGGARQIEITVDEFVSKCMSLLESKVTFFTSQYLAKYGMNQDRDDNWQLITHSGERSFFGLTFCTAKDSTVEMPNVIIDLPLSNLSKYGAVVRVMKLPFCKNQQQISDDSVLVDDAMYQIMISYQEPPKWVGQWMIQSTEDTGISNNSKSTDTIKCSITIPEGIVTSDSFTLLLLDEDKQEWIEGLNNINFDFEKNTVTFDLNSLESTVAIFHSRADDFNYKRWSLGPVKDAALKSAYPIELSVETPRFDLRFHVLESYCYLVEPDLPQLKDLIHQTHTPEALMMMLSQKGIYLLPGIHNMYSTNDSSCIDDTTISNTKCREIVNRFNEDMSLLCFSFEAKSSRETSKLDRTKAAYEIKESDVFTGCSDLFPMHQFVMVCETDEDLGNDQKCGKVFCTTRNPKHNDNLVLLDDAHVYPWFNLKELSSPEAYDRIDTSSPVTSNTMRKLLNLMNLIDLSQ